MSIDETTMFSFQSSKSNSFSLIRFVATAFASDEARGLSYLLLSLRADQGSRSH